jgi:hypothetical protein
MAPPSKCRRLCSWPLLDGWEKKEENNNLKYDLRSCRFFNPGELYLLNKGEDFYIHNRHTA